MRRLCYGGRRWREEFELSCVGCFCRVRFALESWSLSDISGDSGMGVSFVVAHISCEW